MNTIAMIQAKLSVLVNLNAEGTVQHEGETVELKA
jgi:hypothetical protein